MYVSLLVCWFVFPLMTPRVTFGPIFPLITHGPVDYDNDPPQPLNLPLGRPLTSGNYGNSKYLLTMSQVILWVFQLNDELHLTFMYSLQLLEYKYTV